MSHFTCRADTCQSSRNCLADHTAKDCKQYQCSWSQFAVRKLQTEILFVI